MRIEPGSVSHLGMLVDQHLPACNFVSVLAVDVEVDAGTVWDALPYAPVEVAPKGLFRLLLWFAALIRGDLFRERSWAADGPLNFREGETIPFPGDPYDPDGLRVEAVKEKREVVVKGGHKYAGYFANIFLEPLASARTRIYMGTRAEFSHSLSGRFYFWGVRLFHSPICEWALRRLKRFVEEGGGQMSSPKAPGASS